MTLLDPDPGAESDVLRALLAAVGQGERASFSELYDHTAGPVHRLALLIARGDEARAAAILLATYREVWAAAPARDAAALRPLTWVLALVRAAGARQRPAGD